MLTPKQQQLIKQLLHWYFKNGRDLPWRHTSDPYAVLVSEIMLQQTQVRRVIEKWHEFLTAFPTVQDLATANTADVITLWQGLGYNRRALFLQRTAQAVVHDYNGIFPNDLSALKALPGIGDYTARAVLSFAFDTPVPMMDTNHRKFYMRVFYGTFVSDKELLTKAEEVVSYLQQQRDNLLLSQGDSKRSVVWHWNQALMDVMSAVAQNDTSMVVQDFITVYPEIVIPKKKTKKQVPFTQTNRYIRGRIIDRLRTDGKVSRQRIYQQLPTFPKERIDTNIVQLEKDGLIEIVKQSIMLAGYTV